MILLLAALCIGPASAQEVGAADAAKARSAEGLGLDPSAVVGAPAGAPRSGDVLADVTKEVARKIRCPTCQGASVYDSPAEGARSMRHEVERMLAQGYSAEQVNDWFLASYGEFILLEPKKEGANLALWLSPLLLAAAGLATIVMRTRRPSSPTPPPAPPPDADPYLARVQKELDE